LSGNRNEVGLEGRPQEPPRWSRKSRFVLYAEDEPLLAFLSSQYAEVLREQGSMEEIASRLKVPVGTVKSRLHRAKARLETLRVQAQGANPASHH
jgi:DNA-directed RNA polymerase specialized sigma24 family protein